MRNTCSHRAATPAIAMAAVAAFVPAAATADTASGTINYQSKSGPIVVNVTNVYMIEGPDAVSHKAMRELIFTSADVGAKLQTCASMMCASGNVLEGMTVDFDVETKLPIPNTMVKKAIGDTLDYLADNLKARAEQLAASP